MTALLLDIGNTRIKWGVLNGDVIQQSGHLRQSAIRDSGLSIWASKLPRHVETVLACNVAGGDFAAQLSDFIRKHCGCDVHFAHSERQACGVTNGYRQPRRLGADRWLAMIGAHIECQTLCIVVDAGTAVTIDVLDDNGQHLGGQIMPGLKLMRDALSIHTNGIGNVGRPSSSVTGGLGIFAKSTAGAVVQGVTSAVTGAIERASRILGHDGKQPTIVLTGGDALHIYSSLEEESLLRPNLILEGLAQVLRSRR